MTAYTDGGAVADHHRGDHQISAAAIVREDPHAAAESPRPSPRPDELGIADELGIDEGVAADLHAHGLQEPDPERRERHERQEVNLTR